MTSRQGCREKPMRISLEWDMLSEYSLEDLCKDARKSGIKVPVSKSLDYTI